MGYKTLRRLRARREHGEDAGRRLQPAEPAVDARAQRGAEGSRRPAGRDRQGRRQVQARARRLALLHREGAEGAVRPRRAGPAAVLQARQRRAGRVRRGDEALRDHVHPDPERARLPPRREGVRGEGRRRRRTWRCS